MGAQPRTCLLANWIHRLSKYGVLMHCIGKVEDVVLVNNKSSFFVGYGQSASQVSGREIFLFHLQGQEVNELFKATTAYSTVGGLKPAFYQYAAVGASEVHITSDGMAFLTTPRYFTLANRAH